MKIWRSQGDCSKSTLFLRKGDISKKQLDLEYKKYKKYRKITRKLNSGPKKASVQKLPPLPQSVRISQTVTVNTNDETIKQLVPETKSILITLLDSKFKDTTKIVKKDFMDGAISDTLTKEKIEESLKFLNDKNLIKEEIEENIPKLVLVIQKDDVALILKKLTSSS
jgi:hypothetical protein